jgi:hypothetical protein
MTVGRFQVMAVLQAARARRLGLPLESAYSWGLNRAIFYAAAKRGFRGKQAPSGHGTGNAHAAHVKPKAKAGEYHLGDELAFAEAGSSKTSPVFSIGGEPQNEKDFQSQIEARFQGKFGEAWKETLDYVGRFDTATIESQSRFFSDVYRPKRDEFAKKWTEISNVRTTVVSTTRRKTR